MSQACTICLCSIGSISWTLPCKHVFHPRCIRSQYDANINRVDEETFERFIPQCPNCRAKLHKKDLPPRQKSAINHELIEEPAISSMPIEQRPLRMARETYIVARERTKSLLDILIARRERLRSLQVTHHNNINQACNSGASCSGAQSSGSKRRIAVLDSSSSSSQESQELPCPPSSSVVSQESSGSRSRSPISQRAPSPFVRQSQELQVEGMYVSESMVPLLHSASEMQEVQMQITILQNQLETVARLPPRVKNLSDVKLSENESDCSGDEDEAMKRPIDVIGDFGRGQYTRYIIKWSDGTETANRTKNVEEFAPALLASYRRRIRARNTRVCRQRKAENKTTRK